MTQETKTVAQSRIHIAEQVALKLARDHRFKDAADVLLDVVYATEQTLPRNFTPPRVNYTFKKVNPYDQR